MDHIDFDEEQFTMLLGVMQRTVGKRKFFYMAPGIAEAARRGEIETEHFRLVETEPNIFELVEKEQ